MFRKCRLQKLSASCLRWSALLQALASFQTWRVLLSLAAPGCGRRSFQKEGILLKVHLGFTSVGKLKLSLFKKTKLKDFFFYGFYLPTLEYFEMGVTRVSFICFWTVFASSHWPSLFSRDSGRLPCVHDV